MDISPGDEDFRRGVDPNFDGDFGNMPDFSGVYNKAINISKKQVSLLLVADYAYTLNLNSPLLVFVIQAESRSASALVVANRLLEEQLSAVPGCSKDTSQITKQRAVDAAVAESVLTAPPKDDSGDEADEEGVLPKLRKSKRKVTRNDRRKKAKLQSAKIVEFQSEVPTSVYQKSPQPTITPELQSLINTAGNTSDVAYWSKVLKKTVQQLVSPSHVPLVPVTAAQINAVTADQLAAAIAAAEQTASPSKSSSPQDNSVAPKSIKESTDSHEPVAPTPDIPVDEGPSDEIGIIRSSGSALPSHEDYESAVAPPKSNPLYDFHNQYGVSFTVFLLFTNLELINFILFSVFVLSGCGETYHFGPSPEAGSWTSRRN